MVLSTSAYSLFFENSDSNTKSLEFVKAYYNRVIADNEYIMTNYAEIIKSFGFTEHPINLAADIYSDEILGILKLWRFHTYPNITTFNLVIYSKSLCILCKEKSGSLVQKSKRHESLNVRFPILAVFGQIKYDNNFKMFRYRGNKLVKAEFAAIDVAHNIRKMISKGYCACATETIHNRKETD